MEQSPGEYLIEKYLVPQKLSIYDLAKQLHLAESTTLGILRGEVPITPELAQLLGQVFQTDADQWLALQRRWEGKAADQL